MHISVTDPISRAWEHMVAMLFRPFDLGKWFVLGFVAFLALLGEGGGTFQMPNFPGGGGGRTRFPTPAPTPSTVPAPYPHTQPAQPWVMPSQPATQPGRVTLPPFPLHTSPQPDPFDDILQFVKANLTLVIVLGAGLLALGIALMILVTWLRCRGLFMLYDCIALNRAAVVEPWKEYRAEGNSLTLAHLLLGLVGLAAIMLIFAVGGAMAWPDILGRQLTGIGITAIIVAGLAFVVIALAMALASAVLQHLIAPVMFAHRVGVLEAWPTVKTRMLREHLGAVILFFLMRFVLSIAAGIVMLIATCLTCCLAALPYLGRVITLPIPVFLTSYSLYFVQQFGADLRIFPDNPDEPTCPGCGYSLRGSLDAAYCPECGTKFGQPTDVPPPPPPAG
ncbi:MAG: hypothetical protein IT440_01350 [Phycisphaeraceae bacterium]|nr:hypothetical protein [Phycisphaeraceae bacterium]